MGIPCAPFYGHDIGSATETAEKVMSKIETNRFDKADLEKFRASLVSVVAELDKALANENED
jgi:hypothetical protein